MIRNGIEIEVSPAIVDFSEVEVGKKKVVIVRLKDTEELRFNIDKDSGFELVAEKKINDKLYKLVLRKVRLEARKTVLSIECPGSSS